MTQNINVAKLELIMKKYGAIPTSWRDFFEAAAPLLVEEKFIENESPCAYCTESGKGNCLRCCISSYRYFFKGRKLSPVVRNGERAI